MKDKVTGTIKKITAAGQKLLVRIKGRFQKKTGGVIDSPVLHAEKQTGVPFHVVREVDNWSGDASFCTTTAFKDLGKKGFVRHCGPTAVTNAMITLGKRLKEEKVGAAVEVSAQMSEADRAAYIFLKVAKTGQRFLVYHNTDILHRFGGTYDSFTWLFVRLCLRKFGIKGVKIRQRLAFRQQNWIRSLDKGCILYLHLLHHPCYSSHHVLCYGFTEVESDDRLHKKLYLKIADGWVERPRYLSAEDVKLCHYLELDPRKK